MEVRIQAIHFDATAQLESFIQKKVTKLNRFHDGIMEAEVTLKVVKPETYAKQPIRLKRLSTLLWRPWSVSLRKTRKK